MLHARQIGLVALLVVGATAQLAWGQTSLGNRPRAVPTIRGVGYLPGYSGGFALYDHASTYEEGVANGVANVIQSAGAANLLHSQAAVNYQEARYRALDNKAKGAHTYMEVARLRSELAAARRGPRPTVEQMERYSRDRAPRPLGANELDHASGRILWPAALEDEAFTAHRERLEELVYDWVRHKYQVGPDEYLALRRTVKSMESELKQRVKQYPASDYIRAKNLLAGLDREVVLREAALAGSDLDGSRFAGREPLDERSASLVSTISE